MAQAQLIISSRRRANPRDESLTVMLTRLRFKNWRSLRDVEINDLASITVFIGANSSGKTNILDALYFLRDGVAHDPFEQMATRGWEDDVHTLGPSETEDLSLELSFRPSKSDSLILTYKLTGKMTFELPNLDNNIYWYEESLSDQSGKIWLESTLGLENSTARVRDEKDHWVTNSPNETLGLLAFGRMSAYPYIQRTFRYITERWQMLDEGFSARLSVPTGQNADLYRIDRCADNLAPVLEFMHRKFPQLYTSLAEDASWMLNHVASVETRQTSHKTHLFVKEKAAIGREAPVVSRGTRRLLAMLGAYYALDMRYAELPGLVVIEEPDTALNPGILRNFVEQFRNYTEGKHPRQFILTTHNPHFLDYFRPEEVRVVSRGEDGYTKVDRIPDYIKDIWLEDHTLGEVWMTRSFGGLPE